MKRAGNRYLLNFVLWLTMFFSTAGTRNLRPLPAPLQHPIWIIGFIVGFLGLIIVIGIIAAVLITRYYPSATRWVWLGCGTAIVLLLFVVTLGTLGIVFGTRRLQDFTSENVPSPTAQPLAEAIATQISATEGQQTSTLTTTPRSTDGLTPQPTQTERSRPQFTPTATLATSTPAAPTSTSRPTFTPTSPPTPTPRAPLIFESAQRYAEAGTLRSAYQVNAPSGVTGCRLNLAAPPGRADNQPAIAFAFTIPQPSPNDYCGFERWLATPQDWTGYDELCVSVQIDGNAKELVVQFGETSDEVWKTWVAADNLGSGELCLPLSTLTFEWADWSVADNGRIDLSTIDYYGIYVNGGQGAQGTVYVDQLRVVER